MAAAPQRDPHDHEREPIVETQRRVEKEVGTGRPFAWAWIWIPIVIAAFWFCGWGWGSWGGWWWGHGQPSATQSANNSKVVQIPAQNQPTGTNAGANATPAQTPPPGAPGSAGTPYRSSAAVPAATITGTGVAVLDAQNKSGFVGQSFSINNVPVQKVDNNHAVWIGTNNTRRAGPLLAVVSGSAANTLKNLTVGDRVNVTGTVEKAPSTRQAQREWSISSEDANNVKADGVYIRANQVTPAQR